MDKNPYAMITKGDKKPKKEIKEIHSRASHDGKTIHTHIHHHPEHHPNEEHVSSNMGELHDHMENNPMVASPSPAPAPSPAAAEGAPAAEPMAAAGPAGA